MQHDHNYRVRVEWQGNRGTGTSGYRDYSRAHLISAEGNSHTIDGSSDKPFHGDAERWNPEEMLLASLSQCHMLSYLHVAVKRGIVVTAYEDDAVGTMRQEGDGGRFVSVTLRPRVIANSVNFPVHHEPTVKSG
jgi:organic hydroperoxide reductase OsmC/OhrA